MQGTVVRVNAERGFGFVRPDGADNDLFFHVTGLVDGLEFDDKLFQRRVAFDETTDRGTGKRRAVNVRAAS